MATFVKFDAVRMSKWHSFVRNEKDKCITFCYTTEIYIQPEHVTRIHQNSAGAADTVGVLTEICMADGHSFVVAMSQSEVIDRLGCKS